MVSTRDLLISKKRVSEFTPSEYKQYVQGMYEERQKSGSSAPVSGLSLSRTKSGKLSVRLSKSRAFAYVTEEELQLLSEHYGESESEVRQCLEKRKFIIAKDRLEAERQYAGTESKEGKK